MNIITKRVSGMAGAIGIVLWMSATAWAGMVSGEVRQDGKPLKEAEIEVKDSRNNSFRVKSDKNGKYSINLPPGIYKATRLGEGGKSVLIQSSPQPSRQDLDFGGR